MGKIHIRGGQETKREKRQDVTMGNVTEHLALNFRLKPVTAQGSRGHLTAVHLQQQQLQLWPQSPD